MIVEPLDAVTARPLAQGTGLAKVSEPEPSRPVQGTTESLDSGLDVNRDKNEDGRKVSERDKEPNPDARTYDAKGNPKEGRPSDSPASEEGDAVDLFV